MKLSRKNRFILATISLTLTSPNLHAVDFTWDADLVTAGAQDGGGTWENAAGNWRNTTSSTDNQNWANATDSKATFGAGTAGTYAINLVGTLQAGGGIVFNTSGYTLSGTALSLVNSATTNGAITVAANTTATINSAITYSSNRIAAITVNSGGILNLGGGASNAQYTFGGAGTVNMTAGNYQANTGSVNVATFNQTGGTFNPNQGSGVPYTIGNNAGRDVNYTISGGNLNSNANNAAHTTAFLNLGLTTGANTSTLTVQSGGTVNVGTGDRAGQLRIGGNADSNGVLDVQGGALTVGTGKPLNQLYFFVAGADANRSAVMTQSGGTVTAGGIQFGGSGGTYDAASSASLTLSGGSLYVGADGITRGSAAGALPTTIQLQGGTLGADQNWLSSLDMALGTTDGGPIIRAQNSGANNRNIGLSGNLSNDGAVNGTLTKTGGGDLTLSGTNSYSGGTTIQAGRLIIAAGSALPTTGAVQLGNGGDDRLIFNAGGSPTFNQSITIASGAALVMRQAATLTNVTLPTEGLVNFNKDNAATVGFTLDSNVSLSGDLTIEVGGGSTAISVNLKILTPSSRSVSSLV